MVSAEDMRYNSEEYQLKVLETIVDQGMARRRKPIKTSSGTLYYKRPKFIYFTSV